MHIRYLRTLLFALLFAAVLLGTSTASFAQISVGVFVNFAPPPLPVYEQPICPDDGYIWTPGYWAYDQDIDDYYWVPGTWVLAPEVGFLWTPAWWGWEGGRYFFHEGYWGPHVGFYGGINYGFGYFGEGFEGGRWDHDHFFYNRSVTNINITNIHNVYNTNVVIHNETHVSFNGGNGGIERRPTPQEESAGRDRHIAPVSDQTRHWQEARSNPQQRASVNMGRPAVAATPRPGAFNDHVVPARAAGGNYTPPANRGGNRSGQNMSGQRQENNVPRPPNTAIHPRDLPAPTRPAPPNTGNPKTDQKYQQQQEKMFAKQEQERQKLQQKQEQEHQRIAQQNANQARQQQVEQRHQQQTQQLQQRHEQQQQHLQQKQQPPPGRKR